MAREQTRTDKTAGRPAVRSAAEELYLGGVSPEPRPDAFPRLFIDLDVCFQADCRACDAQCSYYYHPDNRGVLSIGELATYALICRRCEHPHCVDACPRDALEQRLDQGKLLIRHNLRCVNCRSCSHACPYGTILPELLPRYAHNCDYCLDRRGEEAEPLCARTCSHGALELRAGDSDLDENTFLVGDHLMVRSRHWRWEKA
jgi:Fe-S-cluster-containing dehydrogenase component